jgi:hypothetical protein
VNDRLQAALVNDSTTKKALLTRTDSKLLTKSPLQIPSDKNVGSLLKVIPELSEEQKPQYTRKELNSSQRLGVLVPNSEDKYS